MRWSLCSGIREHGERIHAVESLTSGNFSLGKETCRKFICPYNRLFGYLHPSTVMWTICRLLGNLP
jgi:hypothetical protein